MHTFVSMHVSKYMRERHKSASCMVPQGLLTLCPRQSVFGLKLAGQARLSARDSQGSSCLRCSSARVPGTCYCARLC